MRQTLDDPDSRVTRVTGMRGVGKSRLVQRAVQDLPAVYFSAPPLPDPDQRATFAGSLALAAARLGLDPATLPGSDSAWDDLLGALVEPAAGAARTMVLVVDDAHRLDEARSRFSRALDRALVRARQVGRTLHVILVGGRRDPDGAAHHLLLEPLPFRAASGLLPGGDLKGKLRAFAVFGGIPSHLLLLDRQADEWSNLQRTVLEPGGPLANRALELLELDVQTPSRYAAILTALSSGEADWKRVHAGVSDLTSSGQVAPYLRRLEELGLVKARRSLDAAPASRSRRYRIVDPFIAFWYRFVLPLRHGPAESAVDHLRSRVDVHANTFFPLLCRQHMRNDAIETVGANAREVGSIWGRGAEIPVAGVLRTGAPFYGIAEPRGSGLNRAVLDDLDGRIRHTRYGYGRERRMRIVFSGDGFSAELRRAAARRDDTQLVGPAALLGED